MALFIGAMIDPSNLSARDIPEAVGYCVDAAGRFFAHPVDHWPRIIAALILLGFLGRLATATVTTLRDGRRGRLPRGSLPGEAELSRLTFGGPQPGVRIVAHPLPVAYTTGLFLRQIVVSTGLLEGLEPLERDAVIAHEQAHVRGGHNGLMFIGGALAKAFGFFSPVKRAVQQLLLGLESAADDRAVTVIGSRIIVARTIAKLAERSAFCPPAPSLGAVSSNVVLRVRRLAANEPS
ncbi:MAG: M56 family metallopeptidase, partial [Actinomycetota bacterium]